MSELTLQTIILREIGDACLTIDQVSAAVGSNNVAVSKAASNLIRRGYVERVEAGCFQLTADGRLARDMGIIITSGPRGPRPSAINKPRKSLRQRAWNVMRISPRFTVPDLLMACTTGDEPDAQNNLQRYCRQLLDAGYLLRLGRATPSKSCSNGVLIYRLVKNTGVIAPIYRAPERAVYDLNLRAFA